MPRAISGVRSWKLMKQAGEAYENKKQKTPCGCGELVGSLCCASRDRPLLGAGGARHHTTRYDGL